MHWLNILDHVILQTLFFIRSLISWTIGNNTDFWTHCASIPHMLIFIPVKNETWQYTLMKSILWKPSGLSAEFYAGPFITWSISILLIHLSTLALQISRKGPSEAHNSSALDRWDVMHTLCQFNTQTPSAHCTGTMCPSVYPQWHTSEHWALQSNSINHIYRSTRHGRRAVCACNSRAQTHSPNSCGLANI